MNTAERIPRYWHRLAVALWLLVTARSVGADPPAGTPGGGVAAGPVAAQAADIKQDYFASVKQGFEEDLKREVVRGHFDVGTAPSTHRYYCLIDPKTGKTEKNGVAGEVFVRADGMTALKSAAVSPMSCADAEQKGFLVTSGYTVKGNSGGAVTAGGAKSTAASGGAAAAGGAGIAPGAAAGGAVAGGAAAAGTAGGAVGGGTAAGAPVAAGASGAAAAAGAGAAGVALAGGAASSTHRAADATTAAASAESAGGTHRFFEVRGARLYTETFGHGQPIVFLHGGMTFFDSNFAKQRDYFAAHRTVIGIDQRGHGH
ncbi:MAG TPA: alpha/beta hydrolase, partial [Steroidobacteraceae bacterium]|nr:alpha/beta hydrolase [Steroidobacteraceae bacterium]